MSATRGQAAGGSAEIAALATVSRPLRRTAAGPVSGQAIESWCAALGETNPVYRDAAAAIACGLPGLIAPPVLLQTWMIPDDPAQTLHAQVRAAASARGFGAVVATNYEEEFLGLVRPGDWLADRSWVESVSAEKATSLGAGHFVTIAVDYLRDEAVVGRLRARTLYFRKLAADAPPGVGTAGRPPGPRRAAASPPGPAESAGGAESPESAGADGTLLPGLRVRLTRAMISDSATASRDYEPVHHQAAVARDQGLDDIICSIVTSAGLITRYVSGWAGPAMLLRALSPRLLRPAYPGDTLTFSGRASRLRRGGDSGCERLALRADHGRGPHVAATVTVTDPRARQSDLAGT
jgi:acyl dehydratase